MKYNEASSANCVYNCNSYSNSSNVLHLLCNYIYSLEFKKIMNLSHPAIF